MPLNPTTMTQHSTKWPSSQNEKPTFPRDSPHWMNGFCNRGNNPIFTYNTYQKIESKFNTREVHFRFQFPICCESLSEIASLCLLFFYYYYLFTLTKIDTEGRETLKSKFADDTTNAILRAEKLRKQFTMCSKKKNKKEAPRKKCLEQTKIVDSACPRPLLSLFYQNSGISVNKNTHKATFLQVKNLLNKFITLNYKRYFCTSMILMLIGEIEAELLSKSNFSLLVIYEKHVWMRLINTSMNRKKLLTINK